MFPSADLHRGALLALPLGVAITLQLLRENWNGHIRVSRGVAVSCPAMERIGIEPMTSWLQTRRSPS